MTQPSDRHVDHMYYIFNFILPNRQPKNTQRPNICPVIINISTVILINYQLTKLVTCHVQYH